MRIILVGLWPRKCLSFLGWWMGRIGGQGGSPDDRGRHAVCLRRDGLDGIGGQGSSTDGCGSGRHAARLRWDGLVGIGGQGGCPNDGGDF